MVAGWTLDDLPPGRLNWRALRAFVRQRAQMRDSALHRSLTGEDHLWGLPEQMLAGIFDMLAVANWQRGNAGKKSKSSKPKPLPRPGVGRRERTGGNTKVPLSHARRIFARHNPGAFK